LAATHAGVLNKLLFIVKSYYRLPTGDRGNWQVSSRNRSKFVDRARFDEQYFGHHSHNEQTYEHTKATAGVVFRATGMLTMAQAGAASLRALRPR